MRQLKEMQIEFVKALKNDSENNGFKQRIAEQGRLIPEQRISIYRNSIQENLIAVMEGVFPVCKKLVGNAFFTGMARKYIIKTPSKSPSLDDYGDEFANFIEKFPPADTLPYLADVARLEWYCGEAMRAPHAANFDLDRLANVPQTEQANIGLLLTPSARLLHSPYPVLSIWETNQDGYVGETTVNLSQGEDYLMVWRHQAQRVTTCPPDKDGINTDNSTRLIGEQLPQSLQLDKLSEPEWIFLNAVTMGQTIGEICLNHQELDILSLLPKCIQHGWIYNFIEGS